MRRLLRCLDARPLARGSRVLALGPDAAELALALRARGHQVREPGREGAEETLRALATTSPGALDCVVALGLVERLRWDRWALQQIHRVLCDEGVLLLAVPDLYSLRSLLDARYVATKLAKRIPGLRRSGRARETLRSYPARRLRGMLERLGFEPLRWSGFGAGGWPPTHHLVLALKRRGPPDEPQATADPARTRRRFEAENRAMLALRDRWGREFAGAGSAPSPLEPERLAGARVLVLSPHPDDEIIGCGGTLLRLVQAGARVTVLQATDGSASAALEDEPEQVRRGIRLEEARAVARAAGFEPTLFWNEDNSAFRYRDDLVGALRRILRELDPALVFTPFVADIHEDHRTLNRILAESLAGTMESGLSVVGYEVWSLAPANLWCDVTACMPDVDRLLRLYETAMKVDDFIHMCRSRNRYHSLTLAGRPGHAEAFFATGPRRFRELVHHAAGVPGAAAT